MTKIEKLQPSLTKLAERLGGSIYYRNKAYWLAPWDLQITYDYIASPVDKLSYLREGTKSDGKPLDIYGKTILAKNILVGILEARQQPKWGTRMERAQRVIKGLREETFPAYRRGNYCYWRHGSMDQGCLFHAIGDWSVFLELVGEAKIERRSKDLELAIEMTEVAARGQFIDGAANPKVKQ